MHSHHWKRRTQLMPNSNKLLDKPSHHIFPLVLLFLNLYIYCLHRKPMLSIRTGLLRQTNTLPLKHNTCGSDVPLSIEDIQNKTSLPIKSVHQTAPAWNNKPKLAFSKTPEVIRDGVSAGVIVNSNHVSR